MAVVKSPKNKKHKQEWVKSYTLKVKKKNILLQPQHPVYKSKLYSNNQLNIHFTTNWKLNNWTLWTI